MAQDDEPGDPDYRFTLANERTFLAWIRTSLGLLAGAVAIGQLRDPFGSLDVDLSLALCLAGLALVLAVGAYPHWRSTDRAMHAHRPLPRTALVPVLAAGTVAVAVIVTIAIVLG